jgi:hypothetical protein
MSLRLPLAAFAVGHSPLTRAAGSGLANDTRYLAPFNGA